MFHAVNKSNPSWVKEHAAFCSLLGCISLLHWVHLQMARSYCMCPAHVSGELRYRNRSVASKLGVTTLRVCCHIFLIFPTIDRSTLPRVLLCWFRDLVTLCKKLSSAQIRKRWGHPLMWQLLWCTPCKAAKLPALGHGERCRAGSSVAQVRLFSGVVSFKPKTHICVCDHSCKWDL